MPCDSCNSERILSVTAKCSDLCFVKLEEDEYEGYLPHDIGIGGGDYIEFEMCMKCGKVQGNFPLPRPEFVSERKVDKDKDDSLVENCEEIHVVKGPDIYNSLVSQYDQFNIFRF